MLVVNKRLTTDYELKTQNRTLRKVIKVPGIVINAHQPRFLFQPGFLHNSANYLIMPTFKRMAATIRSDENLTARLRAKQTRKSGNLESDFHVSKRSQLDCVLSRGCRGKDEIVSDKGHKMN